MSQDTDLQIRPMTFDDLPAVQQIERASFTTPWPPHAYRQELATNRLAHYLVAERAGEIVAYAGVWVMVDEAHVTTFAVHPGYRRQGIGERLLLALLGLSIERHAREATLEVRLSNLPARRLYEKYGFRPVGIRPRYYTDNGEDGLIMTTEPLGEPAMQARMARLRAALRHPGAEGEIAEARGGESPEKGGRNGMTGERPATAVVTRVGAQPVAMSDAVPTGGRGSGDGGSGDGGSGGGTPGEATP
jgi:ribosomal-protein-alanine N-acetyltransferase